MKEQFLNLSGLIDLVTYMKLCIAQHKVIIPRASFSLFPETGDENNIYIDTSTNAIYRWNDTDKKFVLLAKPPRTIAISEGTNNGEITLKVDNIASNVKVHGLTSTAFTESNKFATAAQGAKADSAVQTITLSSGTKNGTIKIKVNNITTDNIEVAGLGSAAFSDIGIFAAKSHTHKKDEVGLGNVDNTADINKSVKYATSAGSIDWSGIKNKPSVYPPPQDFYDDRFYTKSQVDSKLSSKSDTGHTHVQFIQETKFSNGTYTDPLNGTTMAIKASGGIAADLIYEGGTTLSSKYQAKGSYASNTHTHDDRYYTETEMNSKLAGKAEKSHTHSKSEVGLGNVDNTADANKSVKYAGSSGSSNSIVYTALTNTNLNTLQTEGKWYYAGGGNTCTNIPIESAAFELYVGRNASGWRYQQFTVTSGEIYIRVFDSSNWGNWRKLAFTSDTVASASSVPWSGISGKPSTFPPSSHSHTKSQITDFPGALKNPNSLKIQLNGGTTEGTNQFTYDGSAAKTINITPSSIGAAASSHTHSYAGSASTGGSATSAVKLDTTTAGSSTQPVYFTGGKPVACTYTLGKSVPSNAVFTDTNTWRGIQNNLTSDSTSDSLSAAQGKVLKGLVDGKAASSHTHTIAQISNLQSTLDGKSNTNHTHDLNSMINTLTNGTSDPVDTDYYIAQYAGGGSTTTTYHRRPHSALWNYIKSKANSVYQPKGSYAASSHTHDDRYYTESEINTKLASKSDTSHTHNYVVGSYTGNGGQQKPNYLGTNKVGFLMMNTTVNGDSNYKDWIIMDCYSGNDVGGSVALGVNRQKLAAYIMRSAAERSSWAESAELLHTQNYTSYTVTKTGSGASGTWGISISGNASSASSVPWSGVSGKPSSMPASDVYAWAKASTKPSYTKSEIGLGNVDNTADSSKSVKYATSAGSVAWNNVSGRPSSLPASDVYAWAKASTKPSYSWSEITNKPSTFTPSSHTHSYLPLSGGTLSSGLYFSGQGGIYAGPNDGASGPGGNLNNLVLSSWWGISFTTSCQDQLYSNKTAVGIDCRNGIVKAAKFEGALSGNATSASSVPWSGVTGKPSSLPASDVYSWAKASTKPSYSWNEIGSKPSTFTPSSHTHTKSQITDFPTSLPASDVYAWAKASSKPSYAWSEITGKPSTFTPASHTHNYAGSSSAGGSANWANGATYSNYAIKLQRNPTENKSDDGVYFFQASNDTTKMPNGNWWSLIRTQHPGYSNGYWQEIALSFDSDNLAFRRNVNGTKTAWKYVSWSDHTHSDKLGAVSANGFYGMARPDGNTSDWIRTTSNGIIPYQSGGAGSGHCGIGTSSWYFSSIYVDQVRCSNIISAGYITSKATLNVEKSDASEAQVNTSNSVGGGRFVTSGAGRTGIYSTKQTSWLIYMENYNTIARIPNLIQSPGVYNATGSPAANLYITSDGNIRRSTSASKYKLDIQNIQKDDTYAYNLLKLNPRQWFDKYAVENYAEYLTDLANNTVDKTKDYNLISDAATNPYYGLVAEDLEEAGLSEFCDYVTKDGKKELEGIEYDRIPILMIPILRDLVTCMQKILPSVKENIADKSLLSEVKEIQSRFNSFNPQDIVNKTYSN